MATIGRRAAVAQLPNGLKLKGFIAWLSWLFLHLVYLLGFRNRVSVLLNWSWNYLTWDRGPRLILAPEAPPPRQLPGSATDRTGTSAPDSPTDPSQ
jgi:NADH dehydrogenase